MCSYLKESCGSFCRYAVLLFVLLHSILTSAFCACVFANLIEHSLVKDVAYKLVLLLIVLVALYAVKGGIECRARVYEVVFWFVLIPYIAMMLASIRDFEPLYLQPLFQAEKADFLKGIYLVFLLQTPLFFSLFLVRDKDKKSGKNMKRTVLLSLIVSSAILLGSYILLLGNFGANALSHMRFPVITLMSTIQFDGNFLKRMDALMVAVWFFTLFALLNLHLHYAIEVTKEWSGKKKSKLIPSLLVAGAVYVVAYFLKNTQDALSLFLDYYSYIAVPLMLILPGILVIRNKKKVVSIALLLCLIAQLASCSATELEERCFPLMVAVDYDKKEDKVLYNTAMASTEKGIDKEMAKQMQGDSFLQSKKMYESQLSRQADYNHLKVMVFGMDILKNTDAYEQMLISLAKSEEFPRNTYVVVVDDIDRLFALGEELKVDLGTYLEEYLDHHEEKKTRMLTLSDLMDEIYNQSMIRFAPYLVVEKEQLLWGGYLPLTKEDVSEKNIYQLE